MELHFGMISDRDAIYSGLVESKSLNRQLAICHNSNGKLLVKICTVVEIEPTNTLAANNPEDVAGRLSSFCLFVTSHAT